MSHLGVGEEKKRKKSHREEKTGSRTTPDLCCDCAETQSEPCDRERQRQKGEMVIIVRVVGSLRCHRKRRAGLQYAKHQKQRGAADR